MATFTRLEWEDFICQFPNRFKITDNGDGTVTITDEPGEILQEGTPVNAENLNRIEVAIEELTKQHENVMNAENNLSDLTDKAAARNNLGLGSASTKDVNDFLERSKVLADLPNKKIARDNLGLGSAALLDDKDVLKKEDNLLGIENPSKARENLGLGSAATKSSGDFLEKKDNLSGLYSPSQARNNLGLKNAATKNIYFGTTAPTANQLNEGDLFFVYV